MDNFLINKENYEILSSSFNKFKPKDLNQFYEKEFEIISKDKINEFLNKIKINKENDNKNEFIFVIDSNFEINHAIDCYGIIETKMTKENINDVSLNFIPYNINIDYKNENIINKIIDKNQIEVPSSLMGKQNKLKSILNNDDNNFSHNFILEEIANKFKDKNVLINESFTKYIKPSFQSDKKITFDDLLNIELQEDFIKIQKENQETIKIMNDNKNLTLYKSAGNYNTQYNNSQEDNHKNNKLKLKDFFDKLTNNNYYITKDLISVFNLIIEKKIKGDNIDLQLNNFKEMIDELLSQTKVKNKNIDFDEFIDCYIRDYLSNYQGYDLIKQVTKSNNDNIKIVEAINGRTIKENYETYKKYHQNNIIPELENLTKNLNYNLEETEIIYKLYEKYKDVYPEIFQYTSTGSFNFFDYHDSIGLKRGVDGQNGTNFIESTKGSSMASPMILINDFSESKKIDKKEKTIEQKEVLIEEKEEKTFNEIIF